MTDAFGRLKAAAGRINHDRSRTLRIISMPALSMSVAPEILDLFRKVDPQTRIELITADSLSYFKMIRDAVTRYGSGEPLGGQPGIEQGTLSHVETSARDQQDRVSTLCRRSGRVSGGRAVGSVGSDQSLTWSSR